MSRMGDTIRSARVKAKMTEKTLGKKCGMAENVIKDIEAGRRIVSDDQAQRILKILGVKNPISEELEVGAQRHVRLRRHFQFFGNRVFHAQYFEDALRLLVGDDAAARLDVLDDIFGHAALFAQRLFRHLRLHARSADGIAHSAHIRKFLH